MDNQIQAILQHGIKRSDRFKQVLWLEHIGWLEYYPGFDAMYCNLLGGAQQQITDTQTIASFMARF